MSPLAPLLRPPVLFSDGGRGTGAPECSLEAFGRAVELGATGLAAEVWLSADAQPVLAPRGTVRTGLRRRPISALKASELPEHLATLGELYARFGSGHELCLVLGMPDALEAVLAAARRAGAMGRLWLCHPDLEALESWKRQVGPARLVHLGGHRPGRGGPERHAASLREAGVDAVGLSESDWSGGMTALYHRFGRLSVARDVQHDRQVSKLLAMGIDAVIAGAAAQVPQP